MYKRYIRGLFSFTVSRLLPSDARARLHLLKVHLPHRQVLQRVLINENEEEIVSNLILQRKDMNKRSVRSV